MEVIKPFSPGNEKEIYKNVYFEQYIFGQYQNKQEQFRVAIYQVAFKTFIISVNLHSTEYPKLWQIGIVNNMSIAMNIATQLIQSILSNHIDYFDI